MSLSTATRERIESTNQGEPVVLYMKGNRQQPQCGFSATVVGILDKLLPSYETIDVLSDPEIREGIKAYSEWPTIPQLYVNNEFLGGCDVIQQMYQTGDLHQALGLSPAADVSPTLSISDSAAETMRNALAQHQGVGIHLGISASWQHDFGLKPVQGDEVRVTDNDVEILMDRESASRANGLKIDMTDEGEGGFIIDNPNAPPPVNQMSVSELKGHLDSDTKLHLYDVRGEDERNIAKIEGATMLDENAMQAMRKLEKNTMLVFHCHSGGRSQQAAEYFRQQGFTNVHNVAGGIDAWSQEIDSNVPRY